MAEEYYDEEELELLKRKKLAELERKLKEEEERRRRELEKDAILKTILTPEARRRLSNLRLVKPELAENLEIQLIQLVQSGQLRPPITDSMLKRILMEIDRRRRREIRIRFIRGV